MDNSERKASLRWQVGDGIRQLPRKRFLPLLRAAVAAAPARAEPRLRLARVLLQTDQLAELVALVSPALTDPATDPELLHCLGLGALALGEQDLALRALSLSVEKGYWQSLGAVAQINRSLDRQEEALAAGLRALEFCPADYTAGSVVTGILLERGERERLWDLCRGIRANGGWAAYIPSAMALSATTVEQHREVEWLVDLRRWFAVTTLRPTEDFNQRLANELLGTIGSATLPRRKATVGSGRRIDQLHLVAGSSMLQDLFGMLRTAVETYLLERQAVLDDREIAHPMVEYRPDTVFMDSWAVEVRSDGHEEWHLHPSGWLSGVYYVVVPRLRGGYGLHPGEIEFGPFPFDSAATATAWPNWYLRPEMGQLILFPSYYAHRTWPTCVTDSRICVAFDVVPISSQNA